MIPAHKMIALWSTDKDSKVEKLVVVHIDDQTRATGNLAASAGACDAGWMAGPPIDTPLGLFTFISTAYGFRTREDSFAALHEFRKVEGQAEWVEEILARAGDPEFRREVEEGERDHLV